MLSALIHMFPSLCYRLMQPPVRLPGPLDAMRGVQRAGHLGCVPAYAIQAAQLGLALPLSRFVVLIKGPSN